MSRLTVAEVKSEIAIAASIVSTDSRIYDYINRATQRLLPQGLWVGTTQRFRVCTNEKCLTWPRQVETILSYAVCSWPGSVRNGWYEFLPNGPGVVATDKCMGRNLIDRGEYPAFADISGTNKKLKVYGAVADDAGTQQVILQGYDENNNWIRTKQGDTWYDGELVYIDNGTPRTTENYFTALTGIIKPVTNGPMRIYEYNTTDTTERQIGYYEPDETHPRYRRSYVPEIPSAGTGSGCTTVPVDIIAKVRYAPVRGDNDWLLISNVPALTEMVRGLKLFESGDRAGGLECETLAIKYLNDELRNYNGDGAQAVLKVENTATFGAGSVENAIS